jgi:hypothetical protein
MLETQIHPTAVIDESAAIAPDVTIGAYAVIGPNVRIGSGTMIAPHVWQGGASAWFKYVWFAWLPRDARCSDADGAFTAGSDGSAEASNSLSIAGRNFCASHRKM